MKKIICVRCDANDGFIEKWTAYFDNGSEEVYEGEIPPVFVSRFCIRAKYGYKHLDSPKMTDWWMMDWRLKDRFC